MDLSQFTDRQRRYIIYRIQHPQAAKTEAAAHVGVSISAVNKWRDAVEDAIANVSQSIYEMVTEQIEAASLEAVSVLTKQLTSDDEKIAQNAAKLILEWHVGRPKQSVDADVNGEIAISVSYTDGKS